MPTPRCAGCRCDLTGISPQRDNLVLCPECGLLGQPSTSTPLARRRIWLASLGLGLIPIVPCWFMMTGVEFMGRRVEDGWGQVGVLFFFTPLAALAGSILAATGATLVRVSAPMSLSERFLQWLSVAGLVLLLDGGLGLHISIGLWILNPKGGC
jgi:hypothetical protein